MGLFLDHIPMNKQLRILGLGHLVASCVIAYFAWHNWQLGTPESLKSAYVLLAVLILEIPAFLLMVWVNKKGRARKEYLLANGQVVTAEVVEIRKSTGARSTFPLAILAKGKNPFSGQEQTFESGPVWVDLDHYLQPGNTVQVYIDPRDPEKYLVDTSFLPERSVFFG